MSIIVYYTGVSSSLEVKSQQQKIFLILDSKKISYTAVDISLRTEDKEEMRMKVGDPVALPPQICNGGIYCGDFHALMDAVESETIDNFLKL